MLQQTDTLPAFRRHGNAIQAHLSLSFPGRRRRRIRVNISFTISININVLFRNLVCGGRADLCVIHRQNRFCILHCARDYISDRKCKSGSLFVAHMTSLWKEDRGKIKLNEPRWQKLEEREKEKKKNNWQ